MSKILLTTEIPDEKTAASKARVDILEILSANGYQQLYLPRSMSVLNILKFSKALGRIAKGRSHIVVEYPCWMKKRMYVVYLLCRLKGIKLYGVIHDIAALRFQISARPDMSILRLFDGLVSHNASMSAWLKEKGYRKKIVDLKAFDYLLDQPKDFHADSLQKPFRIFYAGNLSYKKATYLYDKKLNGLDGIQLCVYGQEFDRERMNGSPVSYKGIFNPGAPNLPENYHFGLIWEGTSVDTCEGLLGQYIRYNNPHKFSLYLSLGLPVITWREAAIASFVLENNIGVTIKDFDELKTIADKITPELYQTYITNINSISEKVRKGYFLNAALDTLIKS